MRNSLDSHRSYTSDNLVDSNLPSSRLDYLIKSYKPEVDVVSKAIWQRGLERTTYFETSQSQVIQVEQRVESLPDYTEHTDNYSLIIIEKNLIRIPKTVIDMKNLLTVLDISHNKFEYFPFEIMQIHGLKSLKMDHNKIKYIPSEICRLVNLEVFSISHNCIQNIPPNFANLTKLRDLNLENNRLETFSSELTELKNLQVFNIAHNKLACFPCSFRSLLQLQELNFEWFQYTNPPFSLPVKGQEDDHTIRKLRNKCFELYNKGVHFFSFADFLGFFSKEKVNIKEKDPETSQTILHKAVLNEDISVIRYIVTHVPELIDFSDKDKLTPLCLSLLKEKFRSAYYLLNHGANPTKGSSSHGTPLHIATRKLNFQCVKEIIRLGENPNRSDHEGNTPLHIAVTLLSEGHAKAKDIMAYLLEKGANPNARNREKWTPFHVAARKKSVESVGWIVSYNLEAKEILGKGTAFDVDKAGGIYNWTSMHVAAYADVPEIIVLLGEAGADMFKKSINGFTPKRVVGREGVSLKLMEKFERDWIKSHVFLRKEEDRDCLEQKHLDDLCILQNIHKASKNRFSNEIEPIYLITEPSTSGVMNSSRPSLRMSAPFLNLEKIYHKRHEESFEISPEPENDFSRGEQSPQSPEQSFYSDLNEGIEIDVSVYRNTVRFKDKNIMTQKRLSFHSRFFEEIEKDEGNHLFQNREKNCFLPDLNCYESILRKESHFGVEYCKDELKYFKENIVSDKLALSEKLKVFFAMKILHQYIIEWIYQHYNIKTPKEDFPFYVLKQNLKRAKSKTNERIEKPSEKTLEMIAFYELIPHNLINFFMSLGNQNFENFVLKKKLCEMLGDIKHFPAIDFLKTVVSNPLEKASVKDEARKVSSLLVSLLKKANMPQPVAHAPNHYLDFQSRQLKTMSNESKMISSRKDSHKICLTEN